ncbi:bifunctional DNA primase/polymerase [Microbacterium lacus]|uniref:bifunctional DNA primase/polymerase n=1 Tax=Microbacterium lacus TaxID=415217 RepID=UPI00384E9630
MIIGELLQMAGGMSRREAAITLARADIPVFPCIPGGKRPLTPSGFRDATTRDYLVYRWWKRWPDANIGMPTGPKSGFDVVDVDVRGDESGFAVFQQALSAHLADGEIARIQTPSDGMHVYYWTDVAQRCWQAAGAHIDFRGDGGYVVVPPSVLNTERGPIAYRVTSLGKRAERLDAVALRAFVDPRPVPMSHTRSTGRTSTAALARWVSRLQEGERNRGLFWAACRLFETGTSPRDAMATLVPAAQHAGLETPEILGTIRSAWRNSSAEPYGPKFTAFANPAARDRRPGSGPCLS